MMFRMAEKNGQDCKKEGNGDGARMKNDDDENDDDCERNERKKNFMT